MISSSNIVLDAAPEASPKNGDLSKTLNNLNMPVILVERKRVKQAVDVRRACGRG